MPSRPLPYGVEWSVTLETEGGYTWTVGLDGISGTIISWHRSTPSEDDYLTGWPTPRITAEEAREIAGKFLQDNLDLLPATNLQPYEEPPLQCQLWYAVGWTQVLDVVSGCIGPVDVGVFVDHQSGDVVGMQMPWRGRVLLPTRPSLSRGQAMRVAQVYLPRDPRFYRIRRMILRLAVDSYGVQRLTYECFQDPDPQVYGVTIDAHTGEPLLIHVPMGRAKDPLRNVSLPRSCTVRQEPGGSLLGTDLAPPVLRRGELRIRAEHLRAVDGVGVDVDRTGVTVRAGDRVVNGKELGARYEDYGWWVPLRRAATVLGWRVEWNSAKKEAVVHVR